MDEQVVWEPPHAERLGGAPVGLARGAVPRVVLVQRLHRGEGLEAFVEVDLAGQALGQQAGVFRVRVRGLDGGQGGGLAVGDGDGVGSLQEDALGAIREVGAAAALGVEQAAGATFALKRR